VEIGEASVRHRQEAGMTTITLHRRKQKSQARPTLPENAALKSPAIAERDRSRFANGSAKSVWNARTISVVGALAAAFLWAYWSTLVKLVETWNQEPDYSHGFLVAPLALFILWARRDGMPQRAATVAWLGLVLVLIGGGLRILAGLFYLEPLDGWSILCWVGGVVWLLGGWPMFRWSFPAVAFLWFMVPLPFGAERLLSLPLQRVATNLSCWILQCLCQPALAQGNTILLGEYHLEVEQACSGLRTFMGIVALAFAYVVIVNRSWWEKVLIFASVAPIALLANAIRIVVTGLLYQYVSGEAAKRFTHDAAGWVTILLAAGMFFLVLSYLSRLVQEVQLVDVGTVLRQKRG
jgi:exosortase